MKKLSVLLFSAVSLTALLTGCNEGLAPDMDKPAMNPLEKALTPAQEAAAVSLKSSMQSAIQELETKRASGVPKEELTLDNMPGMGEEVIVVPSDDGSQYCLHMSNAEADVSKTYFSSEGEIREGGSCDNFH